MILLAAQFEKRFPGGTTIQASLTCRMDCFSMLALYGPSGCGKTTILRCLAGLERPEIGTIRVADEEWMHAETAKYWTPQQRDVGFLFQEYALFPHLTVEQNVAFGLADVSRLDRTRRVHEMLDRFGLSDLGARFPHQISGGQKQRVALARVLVRKPRLLLLDEPLSALDIQIREQVRRELRKMLADFAIPVILVTHDRVEALTLADQLIVLDQGRILQSDLPETVYHRPNSVAVARMMGIETIESATIFEQSSEYFQVNIGTAKLTVARNVKSATNGIPHKLVARQSQIVGSGATGYASAVLDFAKSNDTGIASGTRILERYEVLACIHAEDVQILPLQEVAHGQDSNAASNRLSARIESASPEGPLMRITLDCGFSLTSLMIGPMWNHMGLSVGDNVVAIIPASAIHLMDQ